MSLISIPNSFFNCLFSSWSDRMLFLAIDRSSFIRAFVVVKDSTLAWRFVTVALKSMYSTTSKLVTRTNWNKSSRYVTVESTITLNVGLVPRCNFSGRGQLSCYHFQARRLEIHQVYDCCFAGIARNRSHLVDNRGLLPAVTVSPFKFNPVRRSPDQRGKNTRNWPLHRSCSRLRSSPPTSPL